MTDVRIAFTVVAGLLLRIGIPLGVTLLVGWLILRMDARWQAEAAETLEIQNALFETATPDSLPTCWEYMNCPPRIRENCPAYAETEIPCWELLRANGSLQPNCRGCTYRDAILLVSESLA
jgi:hypothetical protein